MNLLKEIANAKHATPAQLALSWVMAQKSWIVPIPGPENLWCGHWEKAQIGTAQKIAFLNL